MFNEELSWLPTFGPSMQMIRGGQRDPNNWLRTTCVDWEVNGCVVNPSSKGRRREDIQRSEKALLTDLYTRAVGGKLQKREAGFKFRGGNKDAGKRNFNRGACDVG